MAGTREQMEEAGKKARENQRIRVAAGLPAFKSDAEKLKDKPTSLRLAITCKCRDCEGTVDPHPKWRIGNCLVPTCPLFHLRPYQEQAGDPMPDALSGTYDGPIDPSDYSS